MDASTYQAEEWLTEELLRDLARQQKLLVKVDAGNSSPELDCDTNCLLYYCSIMAAISKKIVKNNFLHPHSS